MTDARDRAGTGGVVGLTAEEVDVGGDVEDEKTGGWERVTEARGARAGVAITGGGEEVEGGAPRKDLEVGLLGTEGTVLSRGSG